jgi:hypothetical protein
MIAPRREPSLLLHQIGRVFQVSPPIKNGPTSPI